MVKILDHKPVMASVIDEKPSLKIDTHKPFMGKSGAFTDQLYERELTSGMYIGIPVGFTYTSNQTVISNKS